MKRILSVTLFCAYGLSAGLALGAQPKAHTPKQYEIHLRDCHFKIADPYGDYISPRSADGIGDGGYTVHNPSKQMHKTQLGELHISFECKPADAEDVASGTSGVFLDQDGKWKADYAWMKEKNYDLPSKAMHYTVFNIDAVNASGYGVTTDATDGDERWRTRFLDACLLHPPVALCAYGEVMRLQDPKGNLLPYVLNVLKSIEFIDDPAQPASQAAVDAH